MTVSVLGLFSGCGGLALGLERGGLTSIGEIERDRDCVGTLRRNRPGWDIRHGDVYEMGYGEYRGVDIIAGGFPCQSFSEVGKKEGFRDPRGLLFFEMLRAIRVTRPRMVVAENVRGLSWHDGGRTLEAILRALEGEGYRSSWEIVKCEEYGVPQKRRRLIIVGVRGEDSFRLESPKRDVVTLREALRGCPESDGAIYPERKRRILEKVREGGDWRDLPEDVRNEYMGGIAKDGGSRGVARRLAWDRPSLTILTTPSQKLTERCHPEETRPLTIRESARLQTFPDDWEFEGSRASQYRQIGNAVPVKLAEEMGRQIAGYFGRSGKG